MKKNISKEGFIGFIAIFLLLLTTKGLFIMLVDGDVTNAEIGDTKECIVTKCIGQGANQPVLAFNNQT